jgi:hypothetical protein
MRNLPKNLSATDLKNGKNILMHKFFGHMKHNIVNEIIYPKNMKRTRLSNTMKDYILKLDKEGTYKTLEDELREEIKQMEKEGYRSADASQ